MRAVLFAALSGALLMPGFTGCDSKAEVNHRKVYKEATSNNLTDKERAKLHSYAAAAAVYARQHQFNTTFCFLIDMSRPSGANRFFVYNLQKDSLETDGLVAHGRCNENWLEGRKYGNVVGCGCTSLGRYKIGNPYSGRFGLAYKLYGLDTSNNNAYNRFVVLHSHECVPVNEVAPNEICQSDGCPTVSPVFLTKLARKLDKSAKPVLLWIYD